ncbi:receptor-type tyrosine-protein phosphatase eta-like [Oryzias latipes]|uniref:receptor-type tyrosine-protein phosphatase eta-like n=1 Tax=Oryzias latipes TaxID=8090 RepID=UPI000CE1851C|nr:receptor-type tyrosine-protein phosphatase eta-like [Oryzias latipes]
MTLLRRSPWSALLLAALLQSCRADCDQKCQPKNLTGLMIGTTNISLNSELICTLSTDNKAQNNSLTDLFPGNVYEVNFACLNCCKNITTKPDKVRNLSVTEITTSSISLNWTEPLGNSSFYRVQWKNGSSTLNINVFDKTTTISNLTAGDRYDIKVIAVAADDQTEGESVSTVKYTSKLTWKPL